MDDIINSAIRYMEIEANYSPFDFVPDEILMRLFQIFPFPEQVIDKRKVCRRWCNVIRETPFTLMMKNIFDEENAQKIYGSFTNLDIFILETNLSRKEELELEFYEQTFPNFIKGYRLPKEISLYYSILTFTFVEQCSTTLKTLQCIRNITHSYHSGTVDLTKFTSITRLTSLETLSLPFISLTSEYMTCLYKLTNLTRLDLEMPPRLRDISALCPMTNLIQLNLTELHESVDFLPLAGSLTRLRHLSVSYQADITSVNTVALGLVHFENLTELHLSECSLPHVRLCQILEKLGPNLLGLSLETINLEEPRGNTDAFTTLTRIEHLNLLDSSLDAEDMIPLMSTLALYKTIKSLTIEALDITDPDLQHLPSLESLRSFYINMCTNISEDGVKGLINLERLESLTLGLTFTDMGEKVLTGLTRLTNLKSLEFKDDFSVPVLDVRLVGQLTTLTKLNLSGCETLKDTRDFAKLTKLEVLLMAETLIESEGLRGIEKFKQIRHLSIENCQNVLDTAVPYIMSLPKLTDLGMEGTGMSVEGMRTLRRFLTNNRKNV